MMPVGSIDRRLVICVKRLVMESGISMKRLVLCHFNGRNQYLNIGV
jgi:hypothetical protein